MVKKKVPTTRWHDGSTPIDELPVDEQLAHQLVSERADLAPSVSRIMDAELTEEQRNHALNAFNESLDNPGDPNRDPRTAIANVRSPEPASAPDVPERASVNFRALVDRWPAQRAALQRVGGFGTRMPGSGAAGFARPDMPVFPTSM